MKINWDSINSEPRTTCPQVDGVLEILDNVELYIKDVREEMEKVRSQNEELREWGSSTMRELKRLQAEIENQQEVTNAN